jgi:hypothetical protein
VQVYLIDLAGAKVRPWKEEYWKQGGWYNEWREYEEDVLQMTDDALSKFTWRHPV